MRTWTRFGMVGLVMTGLCSLLLVNGKSDAGDEVKYKKDVDAIAAAIKAGKMDMVKDLSKKLAVKEKDDGVFNVMLLMKPRDKKGFGVGKVAGDIVPDGIELKMTGLGRDVTSGAKLKKEGEALEEMAYRIAAIAYFTEALPPAKDKGKATKKKWLELSQEMEQAALDMAKAVQSGSTAEVKKAASKVNFNCNNCHTLFRS